MAKASGRLLKGSFGTLEVAEGRVILQEERGIIGKKLVTVREFPLDATLSARLEDNQPPFRRMKRITIGFETEKDEGEEAFFSQDGQAMETIRAAIQGNIERRRIERERDLAEQKRVREANVHQLTLVLELLDNLFQILVHLEREPHWGPMKGYTGEASRIIEEMKALALIAPLNYDAGGLSAAVNQRNIDGIKDESYAIVSVINRDAERLSYIEAPVKGFDLELHEIFVKLYLLLWDLILGERLGSRDEEEVDQLKTYIERLEGHVVSDACRGRLEAVRMLELMDGVTPHFDRIRMLIHQCLNSLIE